MPLFRRHAGVDMDAFTVGSQAHRVMCSARRPGIEQLAGLGDYVEAISRRRPPGADGRDAIAVLNAKMDHAESVNDLVAAAVLACEELVERGVLDSASSPAPPPAGRVARGLTTYEYIQEVHARALARRQWLDAVDSLFRQRGVALVAPELGEA